jgi:predicted DsbA family dithiol-disulfide isomerase
LLHAEKEGKAGQLREELGLAYFNRGQRLADHQILLTAAQKVGLDGAASVLESNAFTAEVTEAVQDAAKRQIHSIPVFFIKSGSFAATVHGSSSVKEFSRVFLAIVEHWEAHYAATATHGEL